MLLTVFFFFVFKFSICTNIQRIVLMLILCITENKWQPIFFKQPIFFNFNNNLSWFSHITEIKQKYFNKKINLRKKTYVHSLRLWQLSHITLINTISNLFKEFLQQIDSQTILPQKHNTTLALFWTNNRPNLN